MVESIRNRLTTPPTKNAIWHSQLPGCAIAVMVSMTAVHSSADGIMKVSRRKCLHRMASGCPLLSLGRLETDWMRWNTSWRGGGTREEGKEMLRK